MSARTYLLASIVCGACVAGVVGIANCGGGVGPAGNPSAPTPQIVGVVPTSLLNDPNAIAIELNQSTTGTIAASGPWCALWDPLTTYGFPCQTYRVNVPAAGTLQVHIAWSAPYQVFCASVGSHKGNCKNTSPVDASYAVASGSPFAFAVGYEGGVTQSSDPNVTYTVTASFVPANAGRLP